MREIDRKCAEIFNWRGFSVNVNPTTNEKELYGKPPDGTYDRLVPYFSTSISLAYNFLLKRLKASKFHIMMTFSHDSWKVTIISDEKFESGNDENLATAIAIAFIKTY